MTSNCVCFKMLDGQSLAVESAAGKHKLCSGFAEMKNKRIQLQYLI